MCGGRSRKERKGIDMTDLEKLLPYLGEEEVNELAKRILGSEDRKWKGIGIKRILPFLNSDRVDELCQEAVEKGEDYKVFLPYLSGGKMHEMVAEVLEGGLAMELDAMYPFMNEADIRKVFYFCLEKEE